MALLVVATLGAGIALHFAALVMVVRGGEAVERWMRGRR